MSSHVKHELQDLLSGTSQVGRGTTIQAAACHLVRSSQTSTTTEGSKHFKRQEEKDLEKFITANELWLDVNLSHYVSEGAEQKVYLKDQENVLKLNDSIYYQAWKDYFFNLLLHNYFFSDTAYELAGFTKKDGILYAIVKQPFVLTDERTDLDQVKSFLTSNGFINTRNNDYFNPMLGVILEDLHDENVLTKNNVLYFIDTVFYVTEEFWK